MAYIKTLFAKNFNNINLENSDNQIYPVTLTDAVFDKQNKSIEELLKNINERLELLEKFSGDYVKLLPIDDIIEDADIIHESPVDNEKAGKIVWVKEKNIFAYRLYGDYYNWWEEGELYIDTSNPVLKPFTDRLYTYNKNIYGIKNGVLECISGNTDV